MFIFFLILHFLHVTYKNASCVITITDHYTKNGHSVNLKELKNTTLLNDFFACTKNYKLQTKHKPVLLKNLHIFLYLFLFRV